MTTTWPSLTRAISVLVPISMAIRGAVARASRVATITARQSEPTKPAIGGGKCTPPSGFMAKPSSAARRVSGSASAGAKGDAAEAHRRDAEGEVVHGRVAHHRHVVEVARGDRLARAEHAQQLVHAAAGGLAQVVAAALVDGLGEAADDVFAEAHLGVLEGLLVDLATAFEVEEVGDDL